ncbi:hypothetical protein ABZ234_20250 [Nocardiopsis sp. NPDC006198]|uniref:hypothetical protein n=1 Tax=Nocardiopsis sp. NPDC006198 TaxID=3154472 RepID=UPI0033BDC977
MTDEFRAAFQRVLDTAASQAPGFPAAVHDVFRLSSQVSKEELAIALEALAPVLGDSERVAGIAADLSVLAGALVESGAPAGEVGLEVLRQLGSYGQAAVAFMHAWDKTGGGPLPAPADVSEPEEQRVEEVLGDNAPLATVGWWTSLRYGLAAKAMLGDPGVRAAVRADTSALDGLSQITRALSTQLTEFAEVSELLRMAEADTVLVLDRASWRGFRVRFDGIGDNFQLHTLLADALIGKEGRLVPGTRPDPRWTSACLDTPADPLADVVRGEWDLVGGNGEWVGNEALPGDIPVVDGERVLVLEPQTLTHSWRAGRRHPHIPGSLEVVAELRHDEAAAWWARMHPAGSVRHPLAPPIENEDTGTHRRPPRHFGVAAHYAEVDSGPMSAAFAALDPESLREDPFATGAADPAGTAGGDADDRPARADVPAGDAAPFEGGDSLWPGDPSSASAPPSEDRWELPPEFRDDYGRASSPEPDHGEDDDPLFGSPPSTPTSSDPWEAPQGRTGGFGGGAPADPPGARDELGLRDESAGRFEPGEGDRFGFRNGSSYDGAPDGPEPAGARDGSEPFGWAADPPPPAVPGPPEAPGAQEAFDPGSWESDPPPPAPDPVGDGDGAPSEQDGSRRPPGAHLLPPMPPGVSDSWSWAPGWKWPTPPER